jgi:hypothetical protein
VNFDTDLREISSLYAHDLDSWLDTHADAAASRQWWWRIMEAIEIGASFAREIPGEEKSGLLNVGARLLALGLDRGQVTASEVAYWQIRLAVDAVRSQLNDSGLAKCLTLSGAVRWALDHMPASREEIMRYNKERETEHRAADDSFYARPLNFADLKPGPRILILQETEMILDALRWIDLLRLDYALRASAESWLTILDCG